MTLVTLKPDTPKLPGRVKEALIRTVPHWPDILYRGGSITITTGQVRVSKNGVFDGDRKVADLTLTPRGDVAGISRAQEGLGPFFTIFIAVAVGIVTAFLILYLTGQIYSG